MIRIFAITIILATASIAGASFGDEYQFKETRKLEHLIPEQVPAPQHKPPVPYVGPVHLSRLVRAMYLRPITGSGRMRGMRRWTWRGMR